MKSRSDNKPRPAAPPGAALRESLRLIRELLADVSPGGPGQRHSDRNGPEAARWLEFLSGQSGRSSADRRTWERLRLFLRNRRREWQHRNVLRLRARENAINTLFEAFRSLHAQVNTARYAVHESLDRGGAPEGAPEPDVYDAVRGSLRTLHQHSERLMREVGPALEQIRAEMLAEGDAEFPGRTGEHLDQSALSSLLLRYAAAGRLFGEPLAVLRIAGHQDGAGAAATRVLVERFRRNHDAIVTGPDGAVLVFALDLPDRHLQSMGIQTAVDVCGSVGPAVLISWTTLGPAEDPGRLLTALAEEARPAREFSEA